MGGIPWQSKACQTCKRRKIKCDRQEPGCGQCIKRGVNCGGYSGMRIFIHEAPRMRINSGAKAHTQINRETQAQIVNRNGLQSLDCGPAMREQVFSSYVDIFFPTQAFSSVDLWYYLISSISALPQKSIMLEYAISAIACIYWGKLNHDKRVFQHGIQLYNVAIRHVSNMITRDAYCDDIIYATVIFQEIETCYCPHDLQAWMAHIAGTNAILSHCRERAERGPLVNAIYQEHQKLQTVIVAFQISLGGSMDLSQLFSTRGSTLFEAFEYMVRPCEANPVVDLLNIFAGFAPLATAIAKVDSPNHNACQALLDKCLAHKKKLMAWFRGNIHGGAFPCSPGEVLRSSLPVADHLFGKPYCFPSLDIARLHIMFWTLSSIVHP
ncbi:hypothetical protein N7532_007124 [Penicillium argentinense]|uniref:Zn(2)-C6 fungal-type domain-containing protein n=1 Tax=Penicillium argentinense TaxID=1131581 RepID=A0A9W9KBN2_9EURO|nr:uncharacterized protein N7532_007124 [Penicillium argentinense]KAJ5100123.1 hypothetical protein N7532_007124 [Penicillium argentinense]